MNQQPITLRTSITTTLDPSAAFDILVADLSTALKRLSIEFEVGSRGRVIQGSFEVGSVTAWERGKHLKMQWRQASWEPEKVAEAELRLEPSGELTQITLEYRGLENFLSEDADAAAWFASELAAPFLRALTPDAYGDWFTDRRARRPSGEQSRAIYRDPLYHYPNFRVILKELALTPDDYLLEIGCGGGALLKTALQSGCRAVGIDHSTEMVHLARELNREAMATGQLEIIESAADKLPFSSDRFTCAIMTGVLGFLSDPVQVLSEMRRVLKKNGRIVLLGSDPALRGTPGAPEPMASRLHFYNDDELLQLGRDAGFAQVQVLKRDLQHYARESGVPEEHLPLFAGDTTFLVGKKL